MILGLQLYGPIANGKMDLIEMLKSLKAIGINRVEPCISLDGKSNNPSFWTMEKCREIFPVLEKIGLEVISCHVASENLNESIPEICSLVQDFGVKQIVVGTLTFCGVDVVDIGLATTPATEIAVTEFDADGGIILTASHNPAQWNALKLLNKNGEFLSAEDGRRIIESSEKAESETSFPEVWNLGKVDVVENFEDVHIQKTLI